MVVEHTGLRSAGQAAQWPVPGSEPEAVGAHTHVRGAQVQAPANGETGEPQCPPVPPAAATPCAGIPCARSYTQR